MSNRTTVIAFSIAFALLACVSFFAWSDMPDAGRRLITGVALIMTGVVIVASEAHKYEAASGAPVSREAKIGIALILGGCVLFLGTIIFTELENLSNGR